MDHQSRIVKPRNLLMPNNLRHGPLPMIRSHVETRWLHCRHAGLRRTGFRSVDPRRGLAILLRNYRAFTTA